MFIHIKPAESETIRRIHRALLFPAPGWPKGHLLMGYDDQGRCPMLVDNECSIYEHRPQICREYDCRVYAATGVSVDERVQPEIAHRVREWVFSYRTDESRAEQSTLQAAAGFLQANRDLFPSGSLPLQPGPLAALAVRICRLFADLTAEAENGAAAMRDADIAAAIMTALREDGTQATPAVQ